LPCLDELFQAARRGDKPSSFGAFAFRERGQVGAILYQTEAAMDVDLADWEVILSGIGYDSQIFVDDSSNDNPWTIQFDSSKPQTAKAVLEWLLDCDKYLKSASVCGPDPEVSHLSKFSFDISKHRGPLVLEKLPVSIKQQSQLLQHVERVVLEDSMLEGGGDPWCTELENSFRNGKMRMNRFDCAKTTPFDKAPLLRMLGTMKNIQGGPPSDSCVLVFTKGAIFDALDKHGESLSSWMATALACSQRSRSNQVGNQNNNLDFVHIPAQDASLFQLRRVAQFVATVVSKAELYLQETFPKHAGKILNKIKIDQWPFEFWEPDQPRSSEGEFEVDLLKAFTRMLLGVDEIESAAIAEYIREGTINGKGNLGDADPDEDNEPNRLEKYMKYILSSQRQKYHEQGDSESDITHNLREAQNILFEEATRELAPLTDKEEKVYEADSSAGFAFDTPSAGFVFSANGGAPQTGGFVFSKPFGSANGSVLFPGTVATSNIPSAQQTPAPVHANPSHPLVDTVNPVHASPNHFTVETMNEIDSPTSPVATTAKAAAPVRDAKEKTKLKAGDRVRVEATGQEGVLQSKAWVRIDGDKKNTQFKHVDLERID
jgi:hypothetical protein